MPRKLMMLAAALASAASLPVLARQATAPSAAPPARAPLPVEAFADMPNIEDPELSPGGKHVAAKITMAGKQYFAVMTPGVEGKPKLFGAGEADVNWWRWVDDDWLIIGIGQSQPVAGESWYIRRAIAFQPSSDRIVHLAPPKYTAQTGDNVIWVSNSGEPRVLISYQSSIFVSEPGFWPRVDEVMLNTGKRRTVVDHTTGVWRWFADGDGAVRMGLGTTTDGRRQHVVYRDGASGPFRTIDRTRKGDDGLTIPALFLADKRSALVVADDAEGYSALYRMDLTTLERGEMLFGTKGYDIGGIIPDSTRSRLLGVATHGDKPGVHWIDPELVKMQATLAGLVKGAQVTLDEVSADHSKAVVSIGGADAPGGYFLFNRADNSMMPLGYTNPSIKMKRMHPVKTIRYKARDGVEIAGVLTLPTGRKDKLPLIVLPHGGPRARDSETWDYWSQLLADRGYAVIQPNYRGSTGYGTKFMEMGEGQWGLAMQDDLNDAVKALADQGIADPKRVCMVGGSYGGYAAIRAAQRDGGMYRCAVSFAGVSDLNRMLRHRRDFLYAGARNDFLREQAPDLKAVSPINFPEQFSIPLLLVHGEKDSVVPVAQSRELAERLKKAGKDVTYIVQPEGDHHLSRGADRLEFLKAMEAFLAKHNPA